MGRLIVSAQMTVDGVMDHNDGWFDPTRESERYAIDQLLIADALLLGREGYEFFSAYWPTATGDLAERINAMPKFVASRTIEEPLTWNAQLIKGDVAEGVAELKKRRNLLSYGCGELAGHLASHGLVDEIRFWVHPVVWGDGLRPFQAAKPPVRMRLIGATTYSSGVVLLAYEPLPS